MLSKQTYTVNRCE